MSTGGVRYHINIKDTVILKEVLTAMKAKPRPSNGRPKPRHNKYGGLVVTLPARAH